MPLRLIVLPQRFAVCRLDPTDALPGWAMRSAFWSVTRTPEELSLVVTEDALPDGITAERGWAALQVQGPLDFSLTGILASLAAPLADADIAIFALSTYDTDYLLVRADALTQAVAVLESAGHSFDPPGSAT